MTWFDKTISARARLRSGAAEIRGLALNCAMVGLGMTVDLHRISASIYEAELALEEAISQGIDEEYQSARRAVLNVATDCLDVLKEARDEG